MQTRAEPLERIIGARPTASERLRSLWSYRELLAGMVQRDLKVRYKNSVLGFAWSLLNPLLYLGVFYVAFDVILGAGIPSFPFFLLSGLVVWNLFSSGLAAATGSITGNAGLVKKVAFPREILVIAAIGSAVVHFVLQFAVLVVVLAAARWDVGWGYVPLVPVAFAVTVVLAVGLGLLLSGLNAYARDTQHLLELALLAWFWMTPIVYPFSLVYEQSGFVRTAFMANPVTAATLVMQRAVYNISAYSSARDATTSADVPQLERLGSVSSVLPPWHFGDYALYLGYAAALGAVLLVAGFLVFGRLEPDFAEEL
jgi:ABC-2 type transport system permease protein